MGDDGWVDPPAARPWSALEAAPDQPTSPSSTLVHPSAEGPTSADRPDPPDVPLPLEPHTIPEIVDGAFAILRLQPVKLLTIIGAIVVPVNLLVAYLQRSALANGGLMGMIEAAIEGDQVESFGPSGTPLILGYVLPGFALVLVSAAMSRLVSGWYGGQDYTAKEVFRYLASRWWEWPLAWLLVHTIEALAMMLLVFPAIFAMAFLMLTVPAMTVENLRPFAAIRRSRTLVKGVVWRALGVAMISMFVAAGLQLGLVLIPLTVGGLAGETYGWLVVGLGSVVSSVLTTAGVAGMTLLLYFDLRVRREALDLDMETTRLFGPSIGRS